MMSRSYRKPYFGNSDGAKEWKKEANKRLRRNKDIELKDGNYFKRENEAWTSPMEHKRGYCDEPRMRRK